MRKFCAVAGVSLALSVWVGCGAQTPESACADVCLTTVECFPEDQVDAATDGDPEGYCETSCKEQTASVPEVCEDYYVGVFQCVGDLSCAELTSGDDAAFQGCASSVDLSAECLSELQDQ